MDGGHFGPVWFVPSDDLNQHGFDVTVRGKKLLRFAASAKPSSQDKWSGYRLAKEELTPRILSALSELQTL
jgi:hypothetical protein